MEKKQITNGSFSLEINGDMVKYIVNNLSLRDILTALESIPEFEPVAHAYKMRLALSGEIKKLEPEKN